MSEFRFHCVDGCGKCCNTPPSMTVAEGVHFYRDFLLMLDFVVSCVPSDAPVLAQATLPRGGAQAAAVKEQAEHLLQIGASAITWPRETLVIKFAVSPVHPASVKRCPKLRPDQSCGIYDRRPAMCRCVPVEYFMPEHRQGQQFAKMAGYAASHGFKCDMGPDAPIVWKDGVLHDGPYKEAFEKACSIAPLDNPLMLAYQYAFSDPNTDDDQPFWPSPRRLLAASRVGKKTSVLFANAMKILLEFQERVRGLENPPPMVQFWSEAQLPSMREFLKAQLDLARSMKQDIWQRRSKKLDGDALTVIDFIERTYPQLLASERKTARSVHA